MYNRQKVLTLDLNPVSEYKTPGFTVIVTILDVKMLQLHYNDRI